MYELRRDIEAANYLIQNSHKGLFSKFCPLYLFSTENLSGYFKKLDFEGKNVLTVVGSGDHVLNSIFYGANNVDCFDINRFTKYYLNLKQCAILALSYDEFNNFFIEKRFSLEEYKKIRELLTSQSKIFWDSLFYNENLMSIDYLRMFYDGIYFKDKLEEIRRVNPYISSEESYEELKNKISTEEITFFNTNITKLRRHIKEKKYDIILLSNICDYLSNMYMYNQLNRFRKLVYNLSEHLNSDGLIVFAYSYNYDKNTEFDGSFNNSQIKRMHLKKDEFDILTFGSYIYGDSVTDAVLVKRAI